MSTRHKTAIIIGAGPAGLCAAYELLTHTTDIKPVIVEALDMVGGISRTVNYKGNRIDIGGHRFFSKSDLVMDWWHDILPTEASLSPEAKTRDSGEDTESDNIMLVRNRVSRIFYMRKFFDYPLSLSAKTLLNLGLLKTCRIAFSYLHYKLFPLKPEKSLEEFFINRFGKALYNTFFKSYTEKVWGVPCNQIDPSWGKQRIKGLSITKVLKDAVSSWLSSRPAIEQKETETSLIKQFLYPKYGPGQLWEEVARQVVERGGEILTDRRATRLIVEQDNTFTLHATKHVKGASSPDSAGDPLLQGEYVLSSMPIKDLVNIVSPPLPEEVTSVASKLVYRDFVTVGILLERMLLKNNTDIETENDIVPDNWIYIQEEDVRVGRLQIFNNWSPFMVKDKNTVWLGLEYFCNENDEFWSMTDHEIIDLATMELEKLNMISASDVLDATVIRVPKAYPAYFGSYHNFNIIREYVDQIPNLFLIGRNGMHRYNNMDHSMLTAIEAVKCIMSGTTDKRAIWDINAEDDYHEGR